MGILLVDDTEGIAHFDVHLTCNTIKRSDLSCVSPGLSTSIHEFPQDLLDIRRAGNLRAGQSVDAGNEGFGQCQGSFRFQRKFILPE